MTMNSRITPYVIVVAAFTLASCDEPARATQPLSRATAGGPNNTAASGITQTTLGRANLGEVHVHSKFEGFDVELKANDNTDVSMGGQIIVPGGSTGWHAHPGLVVVLIKTGTLTFYEANDPTCTPRSYSAGTVVLESSADAHIARNEGTGNVEFVSTQFLPAGAAGRIDVPAPGNCPF
jgi:quercetin dioxygenase-like cupin family protein